MTYIWANWRSFFHPQLFRGSLYNLVISARQNSQRRVYLSKMPIVQSKGRQMRHTGSQRKDVLAATTKQSTIRPKTMAISAT